MDLKTARRLMLHQQGLLRSKSAFGTRKAGALKAICRLGYLQIDAINIVQRAHHHCLWSRVPNYLSRYLDELANKDRKIFEYWSHAAAYLPIKDFRFYLPRMLELQKAEKHWYTRDKKMENYIIDRIKDEGALGAKDFVTDRPRLKGAMWDWKPAKKTLHELFMQGKILVSKRKNFQILYDLAERVLPSDLDTTIPSKTETFRFKIHKVIKAQGLVTAPELYYLRPDLKPGVLKVLPELVENGILDVVAIEGRNYYLSSRLLDELPRSIRKPTMHFLSPFDNAVIQRKRMQQLFNFSYQAEIYFPPAKRVHGYFALPILWRDRFIGRLDPKADRAKGKLIIKNLALEPWVKVDDALVQALKDKLVDFAHFNGCAEIEILKSEPKSLKSLFSAFKANISLQ
ncbi:MAG: winged helix-turn-helix domain-containing protein [Cyclobacteriaceae bacterium]